MSTNQGALILNDIPDKSSEEKIKEFLTKHVKNASSEKISAILSSTPVVLSKKVPEQVGKVMVDHLRQLGASASYVPDPAEPAKNVVMQPAAKTANNMEAASKKEMSQTDLDEGERAFEKRLIANAGIEADGNSEQFTASSEGPELDNLFDDHETPRERINFSKRRPWSYQIAHQIAEVNKELWIILSMVLVAGVMNYLVTSQYMILGFYSFPTLLSAYYFGRRHAVMTAFLTIIMVGVFVQFNDKLFSNNLQLSLAGTDKWYHIMAWGSVLICTAYAMGTLYERHMQKVRELQKTYQGLIVILRHFISKDQYTENHCYRVSIYAAKIAAYLGMSDEEIEDIKSAGLLHDIGKLKVSRDLLYKAAKLSEGEYTEIKKHVRNSAEILEPVKGPLGRIIPIILAHHDRFDGNGYRPFKGEEIPLGARILAVADVYDSLTSDRPYRKAMAPTEAKEIIVKGAGKDFDPVVVKAFLTAFEKGEMDVPNVII